ncbi:hypothetical protein lerEdw1_020241 [Lerista edwardsae]|nr:hypothetical protein lerEdw1_020241 [Lerista edwardsae]
MIKMPKTTVLLALLCLSLSLVPSSSQFRNILKRVKYSVPSGDCGQPLFLTHYIESGKMEEAKQESFVGPLPGAAKVKSHSGFLTVDKSHNSNLFFWFFPAQVKPETAPVLLWLQGGPGEPSMFGLFVENGPFVVQEDLTCKYFISVDTFKKRDIFVKYVCLLERKCSWTSKFSMLYIDSPVGTGFSFTDHTGYATNEDDVGRDLYTALIQFFQLFSEYQKNDFYATGESYAGKYVPAIGYYIHIHNPTAKIKINFKGIAIGDGFCDPEMMLGGYPEFLYQTGLVDEKQRVYVQHQTDLGVKYIRKKKWKKAFEVMDNLLIGHDSYIRIITGCNNYDNILQCKEPPEYKYFVNLLALPAVRKSIHVGNLTFHNGAVVAEHLLEDVMKTIKPWLAKLMEDYKVLLYNGQLDILLGAPLTQRFLRTVLWSKAKEYKDAVKIIWKIDSKDSEVAGYVHQVIVRGAGHILPYDQPERALDMMDRFTSGRGWL